MVVPRVVKRLVGLLWVDERSCGEVSGTSEEVRVRFAELVNFHFLLQEVSTLSKIVRASQYDSPF